ncbi:hypothetical protein C9I28_18100 [Pseudoduganella armeniaca]|uniref:Uncharacterized protein n=1 Tax=Pseudoduganella armeniaca TaxID=2072590 RepID=A0A2R4CI32_9BURK|nr:hypothetical protein C9I28_18100 [Pseudoduganella armeniaca]
MCRAASRPRCRRGRRPAPGRCCCRRGLHAGSSPRQRRRRRPGCRPAWRRRCWRRPRRRGPSW